MFMLLAYKKSESDDLSQRQLAKIVEEDVL